MSAPRVKRKLWKATRYGVVLAFNGINRAECSNNEERAHAVEILNALREHFYATKPAFAALTKCDPSEPSWPSQCDEFEEDACGGYPVNLSPQAFKFLAEKLKAISDFGMYAGLRSYADKSLDDAQDVEVEIAPAGA